MRCRLKLSTAICRLLGSLYRLGPNLVGRCDAATHGVDILKALAWVFLANRFDLVSEGALVLTYVEVRLVHVGIHQLGGLALAIVQVYFLSINLELGLLWLRLFALLYSSGGLG